MRRPSLGKALELLPVLLAEKKALLDKERGLIKRLNRTLAQLGYEVTPLKGRGPGNRRGRRPGRPRLVSSGGPSNGISTNGVGKRRAGRKKLKKVI